MQEDDHVVRELVAHEPERGPYLCAQPLQGGGNESTVGLQRADITMGQRRSPLVSSGDRSRARLDHHPEFANGRVIHRFRQQRNDPWLQSRGDEQPMARDAMSSDRPVAVSETVEAS